MASTSNFGKPGLAFLHTASTDPELFIVFIEVYLLVKVFDSFLDTLKDFPLVSSVHKCKEGFEKCKTNFWVALHPPPTDETRMVLINFTDNESLTEGTSWSESCFVNEFWCHVFEM